MWLGVPARSSPGKAARTPEQASEVYLASRLTINVDSAVERAYLAALAHRFGLAPALVAHLDRQAELALLDTPVQEPGGAG